MINSLSYLVYQVLTYDDRLFEMHKLQKDNRDKSQVVFLHEKIRAAAQSNSSRSSPTCLSPKSISHTPSSRDIFARNH